MGEVAHAVVAWPENPYLWQHVGSQKRKTEAHSLQSREGFLAHA